MTKNHSLKKNLILHLSGLIAITLAIAGFFSFINAKKEINEIFDADMIKSAKIILGVINHDNFIESSKNLDAELHQKFFNRYDYEIHIQAWKKNNLIYNSSTDFSLDNPQYQGFNTVNLNDELWRSFVFFEQKTQIKILILEKYHIRQTLISSIIISAILPFILAIFPLLFFINSTVKKELLPLALLTNKIAKISSQTLKQFRNPHAPIELKPFLNAFNDLLFRLNDSLENEKRFTDFVAHELNTPLSIIKLQAQILTQQSDRKFYEESQKNLIESVNRASHLIDQLLTLSRLESDSKNFTTEKFNFTELLKNIIESYRNIALASNLKIIFNNNAKDKNIMIDANKIYYEIMFKNLLSNAIKYSHHNNEILIELLQKNNFLTLRIVNIGDELSNEEIQKLFDNFYRAKNSKNPRITGSGLGLAIVKKIIDLHNNEIIFTSFLNQNCVELIIKF
jgi:signal transduction histidine kinase